MVNAIRLRLTEASKKAKKRKIKGCAGGFMRLRGLNGDAKEGVCLDQSVKINNL